MPSELSWLFLNHCHMKEAVLQFRFILPLPLNPWFLQCPSSCIGPDLVSGRIKAPNGDIGIDGLVSIYAHELAEATSDPYLNAWAEAYGYENADLCQYRWEKAKKASCHTAKLEIPGSNFRLAFNPQRSCHASVARPSSPSNVLTPARLLQVWWHNNGFKWCGIQHGGGEGLTFPGAAKLGWVKAALCYIQELRGVLMTHVIFHSFIICLSENWVGKNIQHRWGVAVWPVSVHTCGTYTVH